MPKDKTSQNITILEQIQKSVSKSAPATERLLQALEATMRALGANGAACYLSVDDNTLELMQTAGKSFETILPSYHYDESVFGQAAAKKQAVFETTAPATLAVPLLRWGRTYGVIGVIFEHKKDFLEQDILDLSAAAQFITAVLSSAELAEFRNKFAKSRGFELKESLKGISLSKGYGVGVAVVHHRQAALVEIFTKDIEAEKKRFEQAQERMNRSLDKKFNAARLGVGEHTEILETYCMLARDKGWIKRILGHIETGLTAEAAVERAYEDMWSRLSAGNDAYLRERLHDLRDIADRLRLFLSGGVQNSAAETQDNIIIVAQTMGPADLMDYDYRKIRGLIIEDGTPTMHVSIVARALNIPVVAKIRGIFQDIKEGELLALDGQEGLVYINPTAELVQKFQSSQKSMALLFEQLHKLRRYPNRTLDGVKMSLSLNVGMDFDLDYLEATKCDGIGLYRTEIPFMSATQMPDVAQQTVYYKKLIQAAKGKKVIFRSLDVGSDKLLPYWGNLSEENPAIGWRSIRITLDRRAILRQQMRAFLKAAAGADLYVMFPMIAGLEEFRDAKETLMLELEKQKRRNENLPKNVYVGLMIEVPSVVFQLDEILKEADFISVGTNDLAQFMFACDRGNPRISDRYDVLSAPFLRVMREIVKKADKAGVMCSVCGEMAGNPLEAMALIGLGYRRLSMAGSAYGKVKQMVRSLRAEDITEYVQALLRSGKKSVRPQLMAYAYDHGIAIL